MDDVIVDGIEVNGITRTPVDGIVCLFYCVRPSMAEGAVTRIRVSGLLS